MLDDPENVTTLARKRALEAGSAPAPHGSTDQHTTVIRFEYMGRDAGVAPATVGNEPTVILFHQSRFRECPISRFRDLVVIFEIQNLAFELSNTRRVLRCEETNFGLK